eukprot:2969286-Amphidinium_carterae.1
MCVQGWKCLETPRAQRSLEGARAIEAIQLVEKPHPLGPRSNPGINNRCGSNFIVGGWCDGVWIISQVTGHQYR